MRCVACTYVVRNIEESREVFVSICKEFDIDSEQALAFDKNGTWDNARVHLTMFTVAKSMFADAEPGKLRVESLAQMREFVNKSPVNIPAFVSAELEAMIEKETGEKDGKGGAESTGGVIMDAKSKEEAAPAVQPPAEAVPISGQ